jgi:hypothetical protein
MPSDDTAVIGENRIRRAFSNADAGASLAGNNSRHRED